MPDSQSMKDYYRPEHEERERVDYKEDWMAESVKHWPTPWGTSVQATYPNQYGRQ